MTDRATLISQTLAKTTWANWQSMPIAADASARSYTRLANTDGTSVILMDADPATDTTFAAFISLGAFLNAAGFAAPKTLFLDQQSGIAVIEDLGPDDFASWTARTPQDTALLYTAATDLLVELHSTTPPASLLTIDPTTAGTMVADVIDWYADCDADKLSQAMTTAYAQHTNSTPTLALRDVHAENLIWRPSETGHARVGLLDYQDAILAPAGYDLMSLLRDVRRDIDPALAETLITRFAQKTNQDPAQFAAHCACVSAQRNLRILGVFARLIRRDNKPKYAAFLPRVWAHIQSDLAHPALGDLAAIINATLPAPAQSKLADVL